MSHICVLICRVDDPASDQMTELAAFDLPATDVSTLQPETALDDLETTTQDTGNAILRRTLQAQWDLIDAERYCCNGVGKSFIPVKGRSKAGQTSAK